jgi:hypothetical protein
VFSNLSERTVALFVELSALVAIVCAEAARGMAKMASALRLRLRVIVRRSDVYRRVRFARPYEEQVMLNLGQRGTNSFLNEYVSVESTKMVALCLLNEQALQYNAVLIRKGH